jgi:hypothetical protein
VGTRPACRWSVGGADPAVSIVSSSAYRAPRNGCRSVVIDTLQQSSGWGLPCNGYATGNLDLARMIRMRYVATNWLWCGCGAELLSEMMARSRLHIALRLGSLVVCAERRAPRGSRAACAAARVPSMRHDGRAFLERGAGSRSGTKGWSGPGGACRRKLRSCCARVWRAEEGDVSGESGHDPKARLAPRHHARTRD